MNIQNKQYVFINLQGKIDKTKITFRKLNILLMLKNHGKSEKNSEIQQFSFSLYINISGNCLPYKIVDILLEYKWCGQQRILGNILIFLFYFNVFLCMFLCMFVYLCSFIYPIFMQEGIGTPGTEVSETCELPCGCLTLNQVLCGYSQCF